MRSLLGGQSEERGLLVVPEMQLLPIHGVVVLRPPTGHMISTKTLAEAVVVVVAAAAVAVLGHVCSLAKP